MYNLTVRGHDVSGQITPAELATQINAYGIKNVQLALNKSFPDLPSKKDDLSPGIGTFIKNEFAQAGVQIAILSCYINMIHPDEKIRERLLQQFEAYVAHAKYFGASMVASETGSVSVDFNYTEENFTPEVFEQTVSSVKRIVKCGEKNNMLIGIEPGLNHPIYSIEKTKALLDQIDSPYLGIVLDMTNLITAHNYTEQVSLLQRAFDSFGQQIVAIHLKDFIVVNEKIKPVPLGEGLMDVAGLLAVIKDHKPLIYVVLEQTTDEYIPKAKILIEGLIE
ncbi:MAG: sugar phosphate isomerase/epimerase [Lactobacillaceae bacterium]|nr:sugar phosphate isomerase/epimerase [Lactobacillaceae bacterium]